MDTKTIDWNLNQFHGTAQYYKHLFPGKSPLLITEGCKYVRDACNAYWLFDALLSYQTHKALQNVNFQVWEFRRLKKDLSNQEPLKINSARFHPSGVILGWVDLFIVSSIEIMIPHNKVYDLSNQHKSKHINEL
jgi:hypothetical protein